MAAVVVLGFTWTAAGRRESYEYGRQPHGPSVRHFTFLLSERCIIVFDASFFINNLKP